MAEINVVIMEITRRKNNSKKFFDPVNHNFSCIIFPFLKQLWTEGNAYSIHKFYYFAFYCLTHSKVGSKMMTRLMNFSGWSNPCFSKAQSLVLLDVYGVGRFDVQVLEPNVSFGMVHSFLDFFPQFECLCSGRFGNSS